MTKTLKEMGFSLNREQLKAVKWLSEPSVIRAGAGTGKTTVIAAKIMYIKQTQPESSILAISFTRKAVYELQSRISNADYVTVSTFHSFFYRILRSFGYKSFKFITEADKQKLIKEAIGKAGLTEKVTVTDVSEALAKGTFKTDDIQTAVMAYLDQLKEYRLLDFDSLQYFTLELLKMYPAISVRIRSFFDYVLIDEAQDMSDVQNQIIKLLFPASIKPNITFVGDSKQAIYSFRGAKADILDEVQDHYSAEIFRLVKNYRCNQVILDVANAVLPSDEALIAVKKSASVSVTFTKLPNEDKEAEHIIREVQKLINSGRKLSEIAILYRSSVAVTSIYQHLLETKIPFVKLGSDGFKWNKTPYKPLLALLALLHDKENYHYLKCILPILGISPAVLQDFSTDNQLTFGNILQIPSLSGTQRQLLKDFMDIRSDLSLRQLIIVIWDQYLKAYLKADTDEVLDEVLATTDKFHSFIELKAHIMQIKYQSKVMQRLLSNPNADYLRLMSVHSAKGLEFSSVFLIGAADGLLPDTSHDDIDINEENRLAYVAVTRAKDNLYITYPENSNGKAQTVSRFFNQFNFI